MTILDQNRTLFQERKNSEAVTAEAFLQTVVDMTKIGNGKVGPDFHRVTFVLDVNQLFNPLSLQQTATPMYKFQGDRPRTHYCLMSVFLVRERARDNYTLSN